MTPPWDWIGIGRGSCKESALFAVVMSEMIALFGNTRNSYIPQNTRKHTVLHNINKKTRDTLTMTPILTPINILQNLLLASCPSKLSQRIWHWWQRAGRRRSSIPRTSWYTRYTQMQVVHMRSILFVKRNRRSRLLCPCWCIAPGVWR